MTHEVGAYLGGIRSLECLRQRCVMGDDGCWHLRSANGKPYDGASGRQVVWLDGRATTSTQAAWALSTGKPVPLGRVVYRRCESNDCINPGHLRCAPKGEEVRRNARRGAHSTPKQRAAARRAGELNAKVTPELRLWLIESQQPGTDAAHGLGISQSRANGIRAQVRKTAVTAAPSIFAVGAAVNERQFRRQA